MQLVKPIALILMLTSFFLIAQTNDWETYKSEVQGYHYALNATGTKNFTCQLTANFYINFVHSLRRDGIDLDSTYYYPLKFIWTRDYDSYFVLQPLADTLSDSLRRESLTRIQQIKNVFTQVFLDWKHFSLNSPYDMVPDDAKITFAGDTVNAAYERVEGVSTVSIRQTFTRGGQLGRIIEKSGDIKHANYPFYRDVDGKWVCIGWQSQSYKDGEVTTGMEVRLKFSEVEADIFLPTQFILTVQNRDNPDSRPVFVFNIKDFALNEDLQILQEDKPDSTNTN